jgi:hypothetical protein
VSSVCIAAAVFALGLVGCSDRHVSEPDGEWQISAVNSVATAAGRCLHDGQQG